MSQNHKSIEQLIEEYGEFIRPISGVSMLPLLRQSKDAVRLVKPQRELSVGDVPLYKRPSGQYVLHRIAKVNKRSYIIRGDNCISFEKVPKKWVVAVANGFYRDGELVLEDNPEYKEYTRIVLEKGKPFTAAEYRDICRLYSFEILDTELPEPGVSVDFGGIGVGYLLGRAFPSFKKMKLKYRILRFVPILLPFMWLWRLAGCVLNKNKLRNAMSCVAISMRKR